MRLVVYSPLVMQLSFALTLFLLTSNARPLNLSALGCLPRLFTPSPLFFSLFPDPHAFGGPIKSSAGAEIVETD